MRNLIVLTGGPCGGKTTLIEELSRDPAWAGRFAALPEAIFAMRHIGVSPQEKLFQRVMVYQQMALEEALERAFDPDDRRTILCHRGTLDPLAYWLNRGWPEQGFFEYTGTTREEHYKRYTAVIHLVTAADGAKQAYKRWPESHRPETLEEAIHLDGLLGNVWQDHPRYYRLDNDGILWTEKSRKAKDIIKQFLRVKNPCIFLELA